MQPDLSVKPGGITFRIKDYILKNIMKFCRGTDELYDVKDNIPLLNSTLAKSLGGAIGSINICNLFSIISFFCQLYLFLGGYTTGPKEIIDLLRNKSRPYLFSSSLPSPLVAGALKAVEIIEEHPEIISEIQEKTDM